MGTTTILFSCIRSTKIFRDRAPNCVVGHSKETSRPAIGPKPLWNRRGFMHFAIVADPGVRQGAHHSPRNSSRFLVGKREPLCIYRHPGTEARRSTTMSTACPASLVCCIDSKKAVNNCFAFGLCLPWLQTVRGVCNRFGWPVRPKDLQHPNILISKKPPGLFATINKSDQFGF